MTTFDPIALREAIPASMLAARRWLLHDAKKIPHYVDGTPRRGKLDSVDDIAQLATFDDALSALAAGRGAGLGFALGDGWQGIDLDDHRDPDTGALSALATRIVDECSAYTEASPSGRGLHILGHGEPFEAIAASATEHRIEAYSAGRYFTVTGHALRNPGELTDVRSVVERMRAKFVRVNGAERAQSDDGAQDRRRYTEGGRNAALTCEAGRLRRLGLSPTELEAALQQMNLERCPSPLARDEVASIARSIGAKPAPEAAGDSAAAITVEAARLPADWVEAEQHPPPFVVEQLLPEAEAGSLVAPGSFGKSTIKLFESVHIILGRDLYGRRVRTPGTVLCVSKEDRAALIDYRLKMICRGLGLSDAELRRVQDSFLRLDLRGDVFLLQRTGTDRIPCRSGDVAELERAFAGEGISSAWFDTASRFGTGEGNQEAAISLDACTALADAWGRCAVELLHHVSQGIARSGTVDMHAGRGGTAFVDNGRFARQLVRHTGETPPPGAVVYQPPEGIGPRAETLLRMHVVKLTGAKYDMHAPVWIERRTDWGFVYAEGATGDRPTREDRQAEARSEQATTDDAAVLAFVRDQLDRKPPKRMTQNALVEARGRIVKGMSERRVRDAVGRLLRVDGALVEVDLPGQQRGARNFLAPAGWQEAL
jgi:hypothetical protein